MGFNSAFKGLIKVQSSSAFLYMLLVCIGSSLKSVLRYKFLILCTYHLATLYWRDQGCKDPSSYFEARRGPRATKFGKH
jgi:hypothetical protein